METWTIVLIVIFGLMLFFGKDNIFHDQGGKGGKGGKGSGGSAPPPPPA